MICRIIRYEYTNVTFFYRYWSVILIFAVFHLVISIVAFFSLYVSYWYFVAYAFSFLALIVYSFKVQQYLSIKIMGVLLYLGLFTKSCLHFIFKYPYPEPTGLFGFAEYHWNGYYHLSIVGIVFFIASTEIIRRLRFKNISEISPLTKKSPRTTCLYIFSAAMFILIFTVGHLNYNYGLYVIGLIPKTILPFPGQAIFNWFIYLGFSLIISILYWKSLSLQNPKLEMTISALIATEAIVMSVSTLSRGMFIYHTLPYMVFWLLAYSNDPKRTKLPYAKLFILGFSFVISVILINRIRGNVYKTDPTTTTTSSTHTPTRQNEPLVNQPLVDPNLSLEKNQTPEPSPSNFVMKGLKQFLFLAIDRWTGLEGLMAVSIYHPRNNDLLFSALSSTRKMGDADFTETITRSSYKNSDKYSFGTLLGLFAYIFLTDNYFVSFFICLFILFIIIGNELALQRLLNPIAATLVCFFFLNMYYQINFSGLRVSLKLMALTYAMIGCGIFALKVYNEVTGWKTDDHNMDCAKTQSADSSACNVND